MTQITRSIGYVTTILAAMLIATGSQAADLKVGSTGPDVRVKEYLQGKGPKQGQPYVVEFWATWCGPCKISIPHINDVYKKLRPFGLTVIGISDEPASVVKKFLQRQGPNMSYSVGIDGGAMEDWFKAADQKGIPSAFVVNSENKIMWIGNPLDRDFGRIVEAVTHGRYNPVLSRRASPKLEAAERAAKLRNFDQAYNHMNEVIALDKKVFLDVAIEQYRIRLEEEKDPQSASKYAREMITLYSDDSGALQMIAIMLAAEPGHSTHDLEGARNAATALAALKGARSVEALSTSAEVSYHAGDLDRAVRDQKMAWMLAKPHIKPLLKDDLDKYIAAQKRGTASRN
ncbi:MAG: TlpA family protein disulfide reductase [Phycisphaerales bacterium]|nr:TlpA family protein disulfide reductase [Phycisphaerales bacterium]